jgi:putative methionine-R-sulfoxide reductase with GAF domain
MVQAVEESREPLVSRAELARWLSGVHAFITAVNRPASLRELLDLVTATACDLLSYDFCGVLLLRPEERRLIMEGSHGLSSDYVSRLNAQIPINLIADTRGESPSTRAFLTAKPVVVNDVQADPLMEPWRQLAEQQGYRALMSVPLLVKGKPFGVINCYAADTNAFTDSAVELLSILANQAAGAIEAIHLRDQQRGYIENLAHANDSLRQQSEVLQQSEEIHKRLNEVALNGGGIDGVTHALEALLGRRVFIEDAHGSHTAPAGDWSLIHPNPMGLPTPHDLLTLSPVTGQEGQGWTVTPIRISGETVARIWIPVGLDEMTPLDRRAIENAAVVAALEFLRLRTARDIEWRVQGDILDVLLSGHPSEFSSLPARAAQLGHDLAQPHTVMVMNLGSGATDSASSLRLRRVTEAIHAALRTMQPRPLIAQVGGEIVILVATASASNLLSVADQIRSATGKASTTARPTIVVGQSCTDLRDFARAIRIARGAVRIHLAHGGEPRALTLGNLGILGLLLQLDRPDELVAYVDRTLGPLRAHDHAKSSALVDTLRSYLEHQCSVSATGQALFVHPNTVKMRLRKIETLLAIDLDRSDDLLDLRTALIVDDVAHGLMECP